MVGAVPIRREGMWGMRLLTLLAVVALVFAVTACGSTEEASDTASVEETTEVEQIEQIASTEPAEPAVAADTWETDIRLGIENECKLYTAEGKDLATWDKDVAKAREEGLKDAISVDDIKKADKDAVIDEQDGQVFHIGASSLFGKVEDTLGAYRLAYRLMEALGGNADTNLVLLSRLTKNDMSVYNFQQVSNGKEVMGSTVKIALDKDGEVTAVFANVDGEEKDSEGIISQEDAEALVAEKAGSEKVLPELTQRVFFGIFGFEESFDLEVEGDPEPMDVGWVVYTKNEGDDAEDYPYVAHRVKADGTYESSLTVKVPGDVESLGGYRKEDVFAGMEAATYTCEVERVDGTKQSITVPVMYSADDDCYYLGDAERRIAVADFYEAVYGDHNVHPLQSKDNKDWDAEDVYTLYQYLRARDFYRAMGWIGPDGVDTDELLLSGMCYRDRTPFENACYAGPLQGWQCFGYTPYGLDGKPLRLGGALDVMAHEYTHCYTTTTMGQNIYKNDYGAINEAMSDIMGNLVEYTYGDTEDKTWLIGENAGKGMRCMSDPSLGGQPNYVWDENYGPHVSESTAINDNGGVHSNSSLLNLIAADLCLKYDMSLDDAVDFWTTVSMGLTSKADYREEPALLTWALEQTGLSEKYQDALDELIEQTRIDTVDKPEKLPAGQQMVTLKLPDTEAFSTKDWALVVYQIDASELVTLIQDTVGLITNAISEPDGFEKLGESASKLLDSLQLEMSELDGPQLTMDEESTEQDPLSQIFSKLLKWTGEHVVAKQLSSWEEMDTKVVPIIVEKDVPSVYILMKVSHGGSQIDNLVVKLGDRWIDVAKLAELGSEEPSLTQQEQDELSGAIADELLTNLMLLLDSGGEKLSEETSSSEVVELPTAGLEDIVVHEDGFIDVASLTVQE